MKSSTWRSKTFKWNSTHNWICTSHDLQWVCYGNLIKIFTTVMDKPGSGVELWGWAGWGSPDFNVAISAEDFNPGPARSICNLRFIFNSVLATNSFRESGSFQRFGLSVAANRRASPVLRFVDYLSRVYYTFRACK